jgi:hypothetical protein
VLVIGAVLLASQRPKLQRRVAPRSSSRTRTRASAASPTYPAAPSTAHALPRLGRGKASQLLADAENVHVLNRTTVVGHWHHNFLMLFERVAEHDPALLAAGVPRHRLWKVRAHQVILATGAIERPIAFANNDRPGVMLASAARAMVERYGVAPGASGVVFTNNDDAYQTAIVLKDAGVGVRVVDSRSRAEGALAEQGARDGHCGRCGLRDLCRQHHMGRPQHHRCESRVLPQGPGPRHQGDEGHG